MADDNDAFERLCDSLRRNDPSTTRVDYIPYNYHGRVGEALRHNTHVEYLNVNLVKPDRIQGDTEIQGMLSFVKHSKSLRHVSLCEDSMCESYPIEPWVNAIAENSHIEGASFLPLPSAAALRLFQTTKSLKRLSFQMIPHGDHEGSLNALQFVETLEALEIYKINKSHHRECSSLIRNMKLPTRLHTLNLSFYFGASDPLGAGTGHLVPQALAGMVRTAPASLDNLSLRCIEFDEVGMHYFLDGLHESPSVSNLTLRDRTFKSKQAVAAFVAYMQNRNRVTTRGPGVLTLCLEDHQLSGGYYPFTRRIAALWGSNLESLELSVSYAGGSNWSCYQDFVQCQRPTLTTLKLGRRFNASDGSIDMVRDLPNLVYLRTLEFSCQNLDDLLGAICKNGSLYAVSAWHYNKFHVRPIHWDPNHPKLLAYLQRNRQLPELLAIDRPSDDATTAAAVTTTTTGSTDNACSRGRVEERSGNGHLSLMPKLAMVATHTPRMAANHLLKGLLAKKESVGSRKRIHSDEVEQAQKRQCKSGLVRR